MDIQQKELTIGIVIPCFKVSNFVIEVIKKIFLLDLEIDHIIVVDDACPEKTGDKVNASINDQRVTVIYNTKNLGVGGAMIAGYRKALSLGCDIIVKLDGDGQMDPALLNNFICPISSGLADYTKGNRFFDIERLKGMPLNRLIGNLILSFMTKLSSGYWNLLDPTNGYTAIHKTALEALPLEKISNRYFFETDILFRLNLTEAVVLDIPMNAQYGAETSNLIIPKIIPEFLYKHFRNTYKRILYKYFVRELNIASLELIFGSIFFIFGTFFSLTHWISGASNKILASPGTVMIGGLTILIGTSLLLSFINYDIARKHNIPLQKRII